MKNFKTITAHTTTKTEEGNEICYKSSYMEYDTQGNLIRSEIYSSENEITEKNIAIYNDNVYLVEEWNYLEDDELNEHHIFERDSNGKIQREIIKFADNSESYKTYTYNEQGNVISITIIDDEDYLEEKEIMKYDDKGNVIEHIFFDEDEKQKEKFLIEYDNDNKKIAQKEFGKELKNYFIERKYSYDENGNPLKQIILNRKGNLIESLKFTYDEKNRLVEQQISKSYLRKFIYDDENHTKTEQRFRGNGVMEYEAISHYNEQGLLQEEEIGTAKIKYEYEYYE